MPISTASDTTPYQRVLELRTKVPTRNELTSSLPQSDTDANEARYWSEKFGLGKEPHTSKQFAHYRAVQLVAGTSAIVNQLHFFPATLTSRHTPLATVCGPRIQIYGTVATSPIHRTLAVHKKQPEAAKHVIHDRQLSTGGQLALAAAVRNDCRLVAMGLGNGQVRITDLPSRATLRTWTSSSALPVRWVSWFRDGQHLAAAGDDGMLRVYGVRAVESTDMTMGFDSEALWTGKGHGDAVRTAALWQLPRHKIETQTDDQSDSFACVVATGSYDHTIRLWKLDNLENQKIGDRCMAILNHGTPVEAVLWLHSSDRNVPAWLLSSGGTVLKVWNPKTGACVFQLQTRHRKTVTSLLAISRKDYIEDRIVARKRILTGALDGVLRFHSWDDRSGRLAHLHAFHLPTSMAISSLAATPNSDRIAIGMVQGQVIVRQRGPRSVPRKTKVTPVAGTYSHFIRGRNFQDVSTDDFVVPSSTKKRKLTKYDQAIKQFRYGDALDLVLATKQTIEIISVIEELGRRDALKIALSNRDAAHIEPILAFMVRYIQRPQFSSLLIGVANILIDIYDFVPGQSEIVDAALFRLRKQLQEEKRTQEIMLRLEGRLQAYLATEYNR